jgi:hypothetical protein
VNESRAVISLYSTFVKREVERESEAKKRRRRTRETIFLEVRE